MSRDICQCPICRFARKELTPNEMAWYLKGCLEKETVYLDAIKSAQSLEELKEKFALNDYDRDCDLYYLSELRESKGVIDPAFVHPERFDFSKEQ